MEPESDEEEEEGDEDEDDAESDGEDEDEDEDEDMKDRRRGVGSDVSGDDSDEDDDEEEDDEEEEAEEDDDEMEDELQQHHPPPPVINVERPSAKEKPHVTVTAPPEGTLKSVEDKEMDMGDDEDDDEDELSELDSNEDDEDHNGEGEGDDGLGSLSEDDNDDSRSATPDLSKLTRRQRGAYEEVVDSDLMALSNEAQKKKHLTAEEHAMRRAEMARRRKNLSEKRNEEEKVNLSCPSLPPQPVICSVTNDVETIDGHNQQTPQEACAETSKPCGDSRGSTSGFACNSRRGGRGRGEARSAVRAVGL